MTDILSAAEIDALFDYGVQGRPATDQGDGHHGRRARWLRTVDFSRPMRCASGRLQVADEGRLQFAIDEVFGLQNATAAADHIENVNEIPIPETEV
jgi:flagellar motor switch protein FliM